MFLLEIILLITVVVQTGYYVYFFSRFAFHKTKIKSKKTTIPVSVIICAKNESENLTRYLPSIINQDYANFEIILVNDHSTDDTLKIMHSFKNQCAKIRIININDTNSSGHKKKALTQGINQAKHNHLLLTDADCKPNSKYWISLMASQFTSQKKIVLAYGAHQKENSWLNKLIRFETLLTAIQYFSYAKAHLTYMGVGRNLAYTKDLFKEAKGFTAHDGIKSGDDDLFINQVAKNNNVAICTLQDSFTVSKAHQSLKAWLYQKRRHISTASTYKPIHQFLLGGFYITQFSFWFLAIMLLLVDHNIGVINLIIFRLVLQYIVYGFSAKQLKETDLIVYLPFLELFLIVIQLYIFILNLFNKPAKWQV